MRSYEPMIGEDILETAQRMVEIADEHDESVSANFNDIQLSASPGDSPGSIVNFYKTESHRRHEEYVNSPEYKKQQQKAEETQRHHDLMLKYALAVAPKKMTLRDEEGWKKAVEANTDDYGKAIIHFAERWARLMEGRIANGDTVEGCTKEASQFADNEGITGFMYGAAVSILSQVWEHGEKLRCWHNLNTQIENEGEKANESGKVINPALLNIEQCRV